MDETDGLLERHPLLAGLAPDDVAFLAAIGEIEVYGPDEVVVEATGNAMAVVRVLGPYVARVIVANPLQVKAIAHAQVKTDKIDAKVLAQLGAADFLPEVWAPDEATRALRRRVAHRSSLVRQRTRLRNQVHAVLARNLIEAPMTDVFGQGGRRWLATTSATTRSARMSGPT